MKLIAYAKIAQKPSPVSFLIPFKATSKSFTVCQDPTTSGYNVPLTQKKKEKKRLLILVPLKVTLLELNFFNLINQISLKGKKKKNVSFLVPSLLII